MVDSVPGVAVRANKSCFSDKPLLVWVPNPLPRVGGGGTCARVSEVRLPKIPLQSPQLKKQRVP